MAKKFYVVWKGRQTGIFTDWISCKRNVDGFAGARYKSFPTRAEAEAAFSGSASTATADNKSKPHSKRTNPNAIKTYTGTEIAAMPEKTKIFTDGGCEPNPGEAGSGVCVYRDAELVELWYGLYNANGTNNTAELNAFHHALKLAETELEQHDSIAIFCDSKYTIQCITQWAFGWQKKGWKKSGGEIKNLALIQDIFACYLQLKDKVKIFHVNGHVGVEGNELADRMSILAISEREKAFVQFAQPYNITDILAMRTG